MLKDRHSGVGRCHLWTPALVAGFALLGWLALGGCATEDQRTDNAGCYTQADFEDPDLAGGDLVVAEVGGKPITAAFLKHKLRIQLPEMAQEGPAMALQARETLQRVLVEECFNKLGREMGLDTDPEFERTMYLSRSYIMTNLATSRSVYRRATPTPEELRTFYEENLERFVIQPQTWYHHILVSSEGQAWNLYKRIQNGESFEELAREFSTDEGSAEKGGTMPPMTPTYMAGRLGKLPRLGEKIFTMSEGEISEPIRSERGWHIVRIDAVRRERQRTLEEVLPEITQKLRSQRQNALYNHVLDSLKAAYEVQVHDDALKDFYVLQMDDDQLFEEAQAEPNQREKIWFYEHLRERFPESEHAPEALFMIGFIHAEELADTTQALETFRAFLDQYPEHEMSASARLMVGELGGSETP